VENIAKIFKNLGMLNYKKKKIHGGEAAKKKNRTLSVPYFLMFFFQIFFHSGIS
jgi:hypothetical protein